MNTAVNTNEFLPQGRQETAVSGLSSVVGEIDEQAVDRILSTSSSMLPALHGYETARMLETLLTNLDGMVYRCRDDQHWTMELISQGCYRLTGYQPDELLMNKSISYETITDPEDRTLVRDTINEALGAQRPFDIE